MISQALKIEEKRFYYWCFFSRQLLLQCVRIVKPSISWPITTVTTIDPTLLRDWLWKGKTLSWACGKKLSRWPASCWHKITSFFVLRPIFDTYVLIFWSLTLVRLQNFHVVVEFSKELYSVPGGRLGRVGSVGRATFWGCTYIKGREIWRT